jgi:hypothetical protein
MNGVGKDKTDEYFVVEPCNTAGGIEIKLKEKKIDLKKAETAFSEIGEVVGNASVVLLVKINKYSISVYGSGRMMVKGTEPKAKKIKQKDVENLARTIIGVLEKKRAII